MALEIVFLKPKSEEAKEFFEISMQKLHSCRVIKRENDKMLLKPITKDLVFWIQEHNDAHWQRI